MLSTLMSILVGLTAVALIVVECLSLRRRRSHKSGDRKRE
jgi:hypothetical protein